MIRVVLLLAGSALALSTAACDRASGPADRDAAASSSADTGAVKALDADFLAALNAKDFAKAKGFYASDAVMVLPEMAPLKGAAAIGASYDDFANDPAAMFEGTSESTVVSSGGDLAYSTGTYRVGYTNSKTKAAETSQGYYLVVYKKQPDGAWKIVQDVSSPLPKAT